MENKITIQQLLEKGIEILEGQKISNPVLDVELLLCYTLNVDKIYIYTHRNEGLKSENVDNFLELVGKRKEGYPLQYIIEKQEFMGLDFVVGEGVLIPRPDTEILVERILDIANSGYFEGKETINILDIGTGSGAISLSLANYIKESFVYTVDISDKAINIAKKNAHNFNLESKVTFLKGDVFEPIKNMDNEIEFDIIVSNPPYIPSKDIDNLQIEVAKYEPRLALDGGEDGLDFYREIVEESSQYLSDNGILAFEIGYNQGEDLEKIFNKKDNFTNIEIKKDLAGHDRAVIGYWHKQELGG